MTHQDVDEANRRFWAQQSNYVPLSERNANFQRMPSKVSAHILFDPRVDLTSARVQKRPAHPDKVHSELKSAINKAPFETRLKQLNGNKERSGDSLTALGHSAKSAERVRMLNLVQHHPEY